MSKAVILAATAALAIALLSLDADAGRGRGKKSRTVVVATTTTTAPTLPACVPWDPNPPTCTAADGTVIDDEVRAAYCAAQCIPVPHPDGFCEVGTCIASDHYGFPNCSWTPGPCN
jgi:hypothetical protein